MSDHYQNPYAAPVPYDYVPQDEPVEEENRTGPPWEQPGSLPLRFVKTVWHFYRHPLQFFGNMKLRGSWWMPIVYYLITCTLAAVLSFGRDLIAGASLAEWPERLGEFGSGLTDFPIFLLFVVVVQLGMLISGPSQPLLATFRCVIYVVGSVELLDVIPVIGEPLGALAFVVFSVVAVSAVHRASILRSAISVVIGCVVTVAVIAALIFSLEFAGWMEL